MQQRKGRERKGERRKREASASRNRKISRRRKIKNTEAVKDTVSGPRERSRIGLKFSEKVKMGEEEDIFLPFLIG